MTNSPPSSSTLRVAGQLVISDAVRERYLVVARQTARTGAIDTPPAYAVWEQPREPTYSGSGGNRLPPPPGDDHWGEGEGDDESTDDQLPTNTFRQLSLAHEFPDLNGHPLGGLCDIVDLALDDLPNSDPLMIGGHPISDIEIKTLPTEQRLR